MRNSTLSADIEYTIKNDLRSPLGKYSNTNQGDDDPPILSE